MRVESAAFFEVELALCEVNLVVNNKDLRRLKVVCTSKFGEGTTAGVHEVLRFGQEYTAFLARCGSKSCGLNCGKSDFRDLTARFAFPVRNAVALGKGIDDGKTSIVPGVRVFLARISQACYKHNFVTVHQMLLQIALRTIMMVRENDRFDQRELSSRLAA